MGLRKFFKKIVRAPSKLISKVTGEDEARKNYSHAQHAYNAKIDEINFGNQYYENMLGNLQQMQDGLSSQGQAMQKNLEYLEALEKQAEDHKSELANLEDSKKHLSDGQGESDFIPITPFEIALQERQNALQKSKMEEFEAKVAGYNKQVQEFNTEHEKYRKETKEQKNEYDRQVEAIENYKNLLQTKHNELGVKHNELGSLEREVLNAGGKLKRKAQLTGLASLGAGIVAGNLLGAGLKSLGVGSTIYKAAKFVPKILGGISAFRGTKPLKGIDTSNQATNGNSQYGSNIGDINLAPYQQPPKTPIPELGNLPLSLEHFGMSTQPKLKELPTINSALGRRDLKITPYKDSISPYDLDYLKQLKMIYKGLNKKTSRKVK